MAPFVCCLRFEAVATFCQVLLVGVTTSNLPRKQSRNATQGSGKVLRYCLEKKTSCLFWNLKQSRMQRRRILCPLGNLMLPSATLNSLGGVASFNFDKNNRMSTNAQRKVFRSILQVPFILFKIASGKMFKGKNPWIFPHRSSDPSCRNRCPQRSQSAREDFWERQIIANVKQ